MSSTLSRYVQDGRIVHARMRSTRSMPTQRLRLRCRCASNGAGAHGVRSRSIGVRLGDGPRVEGGASARVSLPCNRCRSTRAAAAHRFERRGRRRAVDPYVQRTPRRVPREPEPERRGRDRRDAESRWRSRCASRRTAAAVRLGELRAVRTTRTRSVSEREPCSGTASFRWPRRRLRGRSNSSPGQAARTSTLRARQRNGHMAWASPVFLNCR
jgi:hypothetical protein